jgi:hypothetical protein
MESVIMQYGILGIVALSLAKISYQQYQSLIKKNIELEKRIDDLQIEIRDYLIHDREELSKIMERNAIAFENLMHTIKNINNER